LGFVREQVSEVAEGLLDDLRVVDDAGHSRLLRRSSPAKCTSFDVFSNRCLRFAKHQIYVYDVKVEVNRGGGKSATKTKEITVRAGVMTLVSFDELGPLPMPGGAQRITFKYERAGGRGRECSAAFSPDKRTVLRVRNEGNPILDDKSVRLYGAETGKALGPKISLRGRLVTALAIAPDGKTVATGVSLSVGGDEGDVRVWDATTGRQLARYAGNPPLGGVRDLEFSKDGRTVTITSGDYSGK
jgi:WD40 repeat protein